MGICERVGRRCLASHCAVRRLTHSHGRPTIAGECRTGRLRQENGPVTTPYPAACTTTSPRASRDAPTSPWSTCLPSQATGGVWLSGTRFPGKGQGQRGCPLDHPLPFGRPTPAGSGYRASVRGGRSWGECCRGPPDSRYPFLIQGRAEHGGGGRRGAQRRGRCECGSSYDLALTVGQVVGAHERRASRCRSRPCIGGRRWPGCGSDGPSPTGARSRGWPYFGGVNGYWRFG